MPSARSCRSSFPAFGANSNAATAPTVTPKIKVITDPGFCSLLLIVLFSCSSSGSNVIRSSRSRGSPARLPPLLASKSQLRPRRPRFPLRLPAAAATFLRLFLRSRIHRLHVDASRQLRQLLVRFFFFFQRFPQQRFRLVLFQQFRVGGYASVARHFVMFHALRRRNQPGIQFFRLGIFFNHLRAFADQPFHALALFALRTFSQRLENLFQTFHVPLGLFQVLFKSRAQFLRRRRLRHLWQRLQQLIFRAIQILQFFHVKVFQAIHFHVNLLSILFSRFVSYPASRF